MIVRYKHLVFASHNWRRAPNLFPGEKKATTAMLEEKLRKRRRGEKKPSLHLPLNLDLASFDRTAFPQILAASFNLQIPHARSLLSRSLRSLISLLTQTLTPSLLLLPQPLLSLFPLLLNPKYPSVAALSLEVIGAAALCSLESNAMVASDEAVVKGLVGALGSENGRLVKAACNALMDLATSPFGRERLREFSAVEKLLSLFYQAATVYGGSVSLLSMEKGSRNALHREYKDDNFSTLVLDAVVILVNTSSEDLLDRVPEEVLGKMIPILKALFQKVQVSIIPTNCSQDQSFLRSKKYDLASVIFRISMNRALFQCWTSNDVRLSIFGGEPEFENFIMNYWEESPLLIRSTFMNLENGSTIFSSLVHSFDPAKTGTILYSVLQYLVSCPPISSDELDIFSFLGEVKGVLGSPVVYGQDIRVLKTMKPASGVSQQNLNKERHFFNEKEFIDTADAQKCKQAFQDGYTLALRGMEFRSDKVAAVVDGLAILFGQPSVGANIYLTPPGSQGLAQHYDDHCVFVWQLFGQKQWRVSPCPITSLPRLYEPVVAVSSLEDDLCGGSQYLLNQGDILYVPRGFIHEAHTNIDENLYQNKVSTEFSLHLTLGIEVEAPFEWEGFAHIALHCWNEKQKQPSLDTSDSGIRGQRIMFVILLHIAIRLVANANPIFRKACMVAASPLSSDTFLLKHKTIFDFIIEKIDASSSFMDAFECIKIVVEERNDDSLQWMRWIRHLAQEGDMKEKIDFNNLLQVFEDIVLFYTDHIAEAMAKFSYFKSKFCRDAVFEDACRCFKTLLEKYRRVRRQYMNGMLSLHSA